MRPLRLVLLTLIFALIAGVFVPLDHESLAQWGRLPTEEYLPEADEGNVTINTLPGADANLKSVQSLIAQSEEALIPVEGETPTEAEILAHASRRDHLLAEAARVMVELAEARRINQFVLPVEEGKRWAGVMEAIKRKLDSLPPQVREVFRYELELNAQVQHRMATNGDDQSALDDVIQRYAVTAAGRKAATDVGSRAFEGGDLERAAFALRSLLDANLKSIETPLDASASGEARAARASLRLECLRAASKLATVYAELSRRTQLMQLVEQTRSLADELVLVGDTQMPFAQWLSRSLARCKDELVQPASSDFAALPGYSASGNPLPEDPADVTEMEWQIPIAKPESSLYPYGAFMDYLESEAPPQIPVVHRSMVLLNCGEELQAIDLFTSESAWRVRAHPFSRDAFHLSDQDPNLMLTVSAKGDLAFAALENPLTYARNDPAPDMRFGGLFPVYPMVQRTLVAVEVNTGQLKWKLGGLYEDEARPSDYSTQLEYVAQRASYHHAMQIGDTLYAIGVIRKGQGELFLIAINPESGEPKWHLSLCQGQQENTMFGRAAREPIPAPPVYEGGTMYVLSNLGAVIAVNLDGQNIRWVTRYDAMPRPFTRQSTTRYRKRTFLNSKPVLVRGADSMPMLLVAPTDSRFLTALDTREGKELWKYAVEDKQTQPNGRMQDDNLVDVGPTAFIGVRGDRVFIGKNRVSGSRMSPVVQPEVHTINVADGALIDSTQIPAGDTGNRRGEIVWNPLNGRPLLCEKAIYWPGHEGISVLRFEGDALAKGRPPMIADSYYAGNLVSYEGIMINVQGSAYVGRSVKQVLSARFKLSSLLKDAESSARARPNDARAQLRLALLASRMVGEGTYSADDVRKAFERALLLAQDDPKLASVLSAARRGLFQRAFEDAVARDIARDDAGFQKAVKLAAQYAQSNEHYYNLFVLREKHLLDAVGEDAMGNLQAALTFYREWEDSEHHFSKDHLGLRMPVQLYSALRRASWTELLGDNGKSIAAYQDLLGKCDDYVELRLKVILWIERLRENAQGDPYAGVEARAREAYDRLNERQDSVSANWLRIAHTYPNSDSAALALTQLHRVRQEHNTLARFVDDIPDEFGMLKLNDARLALWIKHYETLVELDREVSAILLLRRIQVMPKLMPDVQLMAAEGLSLDAWIERELDLRGTSFESPPAFSAGPQQLATQASWEIEQDPENTLMSLPRVRGEPDLMLMRPTTKQTLLAYSISTGKKVWERDSFSYYHGFDPVRLGSRLIMLNGHKLTALDRDTGDELWSVALGGYVNDSVVKGDLILVVVRPSYNGTLASGNLLVAIDAQAGSKVWSQELDIGSFSPLVVAERYVYLATNSNTGNRLLALNIGDGSIARSVVLEEQVRRSMVMTKEGQLAYLANNDAIRIRDPETLEAQRVIWPNIRSLREIIVDDDNLIVVSHFGQMKAFNSASGEEQWQVQLDGSSSVNDVWLISGKLLLLSNFNPSRDEPARGPAHAVHVYDARSGEFSYQRVLMETEPGGSILLQGRSPFSTGAAFALSERDMSANSGQIFVKPAKIAVMLTDTSAPLLEFQLPGETHQYRSRTDVIVGEGGVVIHSMEKIIGFRALSED